jgi:hypothetical protein
VVLLGSGLTASISNGSREQSVRQPGKGPDDGYFVDDLGDVAISAMGKAHRDHLLPRRSAAFWRMRVRSRTNVLEAGESQDGQRTGTYCIASKM